MKKKPKMDPSIMKSEFMWEQPKKKPKFYKNWKLYAIALPVVAVAAGTGSGVAIAVNNNHKKIDLSTVGFNVKVQGSEGMGASEALAAFLSQNQEKYPDLKNKVTYKKDNSDFLAPSYTTDGHLTVIPAKKSNYSGQITVQILQIGQFDLSGLDQSELAFDDFAPKTITQDLVFAAFLEKQQGHDFADLKDNVNLEFTKPTYNQRGSLVITAKPDGKYKNSITINIAQFKTVALSSLNKTALTGTVGMTQPDALEAFLENNPNNRDLEQYVEVEFHEPHYNASGSLVITAKPDGKYTGKAITITINSIEKKDLNTVGLNQNLETQFTDKTKAFNAFLELNKNQFPNLADEVEPGVLTPSNWGKAGKLVINAKDGDYEYTGSIDVTIPPLPTVALSSLKQDNLTGTEGMTQPDALEAFLKNNPNNRDLEQYVEVEFHEPHYNAPGSLAITAKPNGKYTGDAIRITINSIEQTSLNKDKDLGINVILKNNQYGLDNSQAAFDEFVELNSSFGFGSTTHLVEGSFKPAKYGVPGSFEVRANEGDNKYSGSVWVTIPLLQKISISGLNNQELEGTEGMTEGDAWKAFLNNNSGYNDLKEYVDLVFVAPTRYATGHLGIKAKTGEGIKYEGNVTVPISKLPQIDLNETDFVMPKGPSSKMLTPEDTLKVFLEANEKGYPDLKGNVEVDATSFKAPTDTEEGHYTINSIVTIPNNKYVGSKDGIISPFNSKALNGLENLVKEVPLETTKENALQAFIDANNKTYPDLEGNVEFVEDSFSGSSPTEKGHYTIQAKGGQYKYKGSVTITIPLKKVLSSVITKNVINKTITDSNQIISEVLTLNPDSGLNKDDLEIVDGTFVPSNGVVSGKAQIKAVNQNIFSVDPVEITFGIMPIDRELKQLIDNIKSTQRNSDQERIAYKRYFDYYSNEKLQNLADKLGTVYEVRHSDSRNEQEQGIEQAIQKNINTLLSQVIVDKDGLSHDKYGYDTYQGANVTGSFNSNGKNFDANIRSDFVWKKRTDETNDYIISKISTLKFMVKYVD